MVCWVLLLNGSVANFVDRWMKMKPCSEAIVWKVCERIGRIDLDSFSYRRMMWIHGCDLHVVYAFEMKRRGPGFEIEASSAALVPTLPYFAEVAVLVAVVDNVLSLACAVVLQNLSCDCATIDLAFAVVD